MLACAVRVSHGFALLVFAAGRGDGLARGRLTTSTEISARFFPERKAVIPEVGKKTSVSA
jgi:hypothetical protein